MCEYIIAEDFNMDKYIFDENNGLWYERQGDYYIPCLTLPAEEEQPIGLWGQRHLRYIRKYRKALYTSLQLSGKLNSYLTDVDQQAQDWLETIIQLTAQAQGVTKALKAADQMAWVGRMNNIQASAVIYCLIGTAKETGLDPFRYLTWVLETAPTLDRTVESWAVPLLPANAPEFCATT